jgi:hypothetical protein
MVVMVVMAFAAREHTHDVTLITDASLVEVMLTSRTWRWECRLCGLEIGKRVGRRPKPVPLQHPREVRAGFGVEQTASSRNWSGLSENESCIVPESTVAHSMPSVHAGD